MSTRAQRINARQDRIYEKAMQLKRAARLREGQHVKYGEFIGTVQRLYSDGDCEGARMYDVRLPGGLVCVCGSDLIPAT